MTVAPAGFGVLTLKSAGTLITGGVWSTRFTVTSKSALPVLPCESVALQVTVVVPTGKVLPDAGLHVGVSGPSLRGSGVPHDLRKAKPYSAIDQFQFEIPVGQYGDVYDRYRVRMAEMRQSREIVKQAVERMPDGPINVQDRKIVPPPRAELDSSMEAVMLPRQGSGTCSRFNSRRRIVVNCAGLGARDLVGDPTLRPVRGQHLVLENPPALRTSS